MVFLELELNIKFPTCWDGVNTETQNGNPHVIYSPDCDPDHDNECFHHSCPNSNPQKGFMRNIVIYLQSLFTIGIGSRRGALTGRQ